MRSEYIVRRLASCFLEGEMTIDGIVARAEWMLGMPWVWLHPLAQRYISQIVGRTRPTHRDVVNFLKNDRGFQRALAKHASALYVAEWLSEPPRMRPVSAAEKWDLPVIESSGELANWLQLDAQELEWFADLKGISHKAGSPRVDHYHYRILAKRSGRVRLIEIPKPRLKQLQRQVLTQILERVPVHAAVHGFVKGRSIQTFAAPHVGRPIVLRMDLQDYFPSFAAARVRALFRTLGYPEAVADRIGGICSNIAPPSLWKNTTAGIDRVYLREAKDLYSRPHLPQGAPSSPALANLCSFRVDCRLSGLAKAVGAQYTRYADDLAFSGDRTLERCMDRFSTQIAAILMDEGFAVNFRKTRIMRESAQQLLAGIVTNQRLNVKRVDYDRLKAILTNCARLGPDSQNRDGHTNFRSHLEGRISFVELIHQARGERLRRIFEQIQW